jgi:ATP-dependent DNA helicase RecQ
MVNNAAEKILKQYWGHENFRPLQVEIIESILAGNDTLALLPTGGGKSVCFQVPAMLMDGLCLVVSPLIALMKDQVQNLRSKGIPALQVFSGMPYRDVVQALKNAASGQYKFLYCSPERLHSSLFREYLPGIPINFVAVDEAHCISQWGYDFRPAYMNIAALRELKPGIPFLALTASATTEVREDIMKQLGFKNGKLFKKSFARTNLGYRVIETDSRIHRCISILQRTEGSAIVYCKSRKRTQEIAELLKLEKISADYYHAGLDAETRNVRQEDWIENRTRVIVCTNAFGMGIDKPDVRIVIHVDCPDSLEHYYQEAGRAGRDGKKSYALLLRSPLQVAELKTLPAIRYPSMEVVRKVYQALGDYLQVAAGTGEDVYFDFDLAEFVKRFRLNVFEAMYALQALDQEGIISMNEQVFVPSKLEVIASKEMLAWYEEQNPVTEPLIKTLLRTYGGILDQPTGISEKQLARLLRRDYAEVKNALQLLHQSGIVNYIPRKMNPQVRWLQHRVKAADLYIDHQRYKERKKAFEKRLGAMIHYLEDKNTCRSKLICAYFGDPGTDNCGICDYCVSLVNQKITEEKYRLVTIRIQEMLGNSSLQPAQLMDRLGDLNATDSKKIIDHLLAEGKLRVKKDGSIGWS